jgi:hypothetical protein
MKPHVFVIDEAQRQMLLLAISWLAVERPGWDFMAGETAELLHGREMFESFKDMRKEPRTYEGCTWQ